MIIDGRIIAKEIFDELAKKVAVLKSKNITPHLVVMLVGNDPASSKYVEQKQIKGNEIGAVVTVEHLDSQISEKELLSKIDLINNDKFVHGIIIQRPLPSHINSKRVSEAVIPEKDIDGFNSQTTFTPPIVLSAMRMIEEAVGKNGENLLNLLKHKNIALVGKGEAGGGPIIEYFNKHKIPFAVVDSKTKNPDSITLNADIIITSVGKSNIVNSRNAKKGVILIGIGLYKSENGKLAGDYNEEEIENIASFYTPSPGGMGPVNVAMLLQNLIKAAQSTP